MNIKIAGHPRTGNHWLCALITKNFSTIDPENYMHYWGTHQIPHSEWVPEIDTKFLYIYRNWEHVEKSCFKLKDQWGLNDVDFDAWKKIRYCDMYRSGRLKNWRYVDINGKKHSFQKGTTYWKDIYMTPEQYFNHHVNFWKERSKFPNVLMIDYDNLKNNFQSNMLEISKFLESDKVEFENIKFKIGWAEHETKI